jgi:hypothetical protein
VPALTRLTKDIELLLLEHEIAPVYEWTPRENNVLADRLSKRWDQSWCLTYEAISVVHSRFPDAPVTLKRFNTYSNYLEVRERKSEVIIAPFWPSQRWWPLLMQSSQEVHWLGTADEVFDPRWRQDPVGVGCPTWWICACLLL